MIGTLRIRMITCNPIRQARNNRLKKEKVKGATGTSWPLRATAQEPSNASTDGLAERSMGGVNQ